MIRQNEVTQQKTLLNEKSKTFVTSEFEKMNLLW